MDSEDYQGGNKEDEAKKEAEKEKERKELEELKLAEEKKKKEDEAKAKALQAAKEAEAKEKAKKEAEAKEKAEKELKAKKEAEAKEKAEKEMKAKQEAETAAKAQADLEEKNRQEAAKKPRKYSHEAIQKPTETKITIPRSVAPLSAETHPPTATSAILARPPNPSEVSSIVNDYSKGEIDLENLEDEGFTRFGVNSASGMAIGGRDIDFTTVGKSNIDRLTKSPVQSRLYLEQLLSFIWLCLKTTQFLQMRQSLTMQCCTILRWERSKGSKELLSTILG